MLTTTKGKNLTTYLPDYVIYDLETTGVSCNYDQVVEISAIKVKNHKPVEEFSSLVNPQCPIPYGASSVNGITDDMVEDAPLFDTVLDDFIRFIGDLPLIGHNIHRFDMNFIYRDCEKFFGRIPGNDYVDTLKIARICLPNLGSHSLTNLAEYFGLSTDGAHRALCDCRMTQQVYEKLGKMMTADPDAFRICPKCGNLLVKRDGKYGLFMGCSSFPDCRYTQPV